MCIDILIIEDDKELGDMLTYFLSTVENYSVFRHNSGENALNLVIEKTPRLILLDIQLPVHTGFEILTSLRDASILTPVIMMTANDSELSETNALVLGADDYIRKPIRANVLKERIKRLISPTVKLQEKLILSMKESQLLYQDITVHLLPSEFEILEILAQSDEPKSVHDLFFDIHGYEANADDKSIYMRLSSLRKKISKYFVGQELIKNKRSRGFYLTRDIEKQ
ncbi:DNA-binding response regulator [Veronia nyctiphanis]|uniref:DNA-binding response regulator n=1 Tax=Veronia nyctiphanis TaxID=1278244 RepID=A0A4Q0YNP3_9GAMM|nr:response regulator transcription factor [Veronia nyctiphanis]RXJ71821.1 DNA-binding response regulator [Veronia nyctiphanis]RXJ72572.1 DNA-binding response regulator [Veronia nyctiphanis]